jgi:hypothetical protein
MRGAMIDLDRSTSPTRGRPADRPARTALDRRSSSASIVDLGRIAEVLS